MDVAGQGHDCRRGARLLARQLKTGHALGLKEIVILSARKALLRTLVPQAEKYDQKLA
jgi:hypothetical protein